MKFMLVRWACGHEVRHGSDTPGENGTGPCPYCEIERLREAAQTVVDRWDTPLWKDAEPTAAVIARLRNAIAGTADQPEATRCHWDDCPHGPDCVHADPTDGAA